VTDVVRILQSEGLHVVSSIHYQRRSASNKLTGARWAVRTCWGRDPTGDGPLGVCRHLTNDQLMFEACHKAGRATVRRFEAQR
jgi:hypothetical protein